MAQMIFSRVGHAIGGSIGAFIGAQIGAAADRTLINSLSPTRQVGPRLSALRVAQGAQNDPVPQVFGRARLAPSLIWAARFKENRTTKRANKNSPKVESFAYSLSFALGLCEGPIEGIGRIWADGALIDGASLNYRLYLGDETQMPDALIEAIEGDAPAYRGLAYMVFEDFDVTAFGNRLPSFSIEVFRRPKGDYDDLESKITSVCMIPGAGEFVYVTTDVATLKGLTEAQTLTRHSGQGVSDFELALDQLEAQLPHVTSVNLVVSWFGTDLRAGHCQIWPGVERRDTLTTPQTWSVSGLDRNAAHLVSTYGADQRPAYGGTPSDQSVIEAITALKARGYSVTLIPFILMDIDPSNSLPDPYGGEAQSAYPWRGRITCDVAPNRVGTQDKTAQINSDIAAFVGTATATDFAINGTSVTYSGAPDFGFARFILHMAALSKAAGGVEAIVLGSELRGLTTLRSGSNAYPFVTALKSLAAQVRIIVGAGTKISYGADWSEYFGHHANDGTGDIYFHLDPLWSDANIDFIGIDWYAPLSDWRDGNDHLDAQSGALSQYDRPYLQARMRAGEGFEWYYASDLARNTQARTPIVDTAYGQDWVFRPKDIHSWWQNRHFNRPNGVKSATATAWVAQSKPIRFIEYGCAAIDKGANAPNRFLDPKSSESAVPYYSNSKRDDRAQAAYLMAFHDFYAQNNPLSSVYGGAMVERMSVWCWDARPYPYFPARSDLWGDSGNWTTGHWLNGRVGAGAAKNIIAEIAAQASVAMGDLELSALEGRIDSFVIEQPMRAKDALGPILSYLGADYAPRGGKIAFFNQDVTPPVPIDPAALADFGQDPLMEKRSLAEVPSILSLRCYDLDRDYQIMGLQVRDSAHDGAARVTLDLPLGLSQSQAHRFTDAALKAAQGLRQTKRLDIDPLLALKLEIGDRLSLGAAEDIWRIQAIEVDEQPHMVLAPWVEPAVMETAAPQVSTTATGAQISWMTQFRLIDHPPLWGEGDVFAPILIAAASPFQGVDVYAGPSAQGLRQRGALTTPLGFGKCVTALNSRFGTVRQTEAVLDIYLEGAPLSAKTWDEVLGGENYLMIEARNGAWEVVQFQSATVVGVNLYRLKGLVRGQWGTEAAFEAGFEAGAAVLVIEGAVVRADIGLNELGLDWLWRAGVSGFGGVSAGAKDVSYRWAGQGLVPRAPVHPKVLGQFGHDMRLSFVRVARGGGDSFDTEPPLYEDRDVYRLRFFQGADLLREIEVTDTTYDYGAAQQLSDYPFGFDAESVVKIAQKSSIVGYGRELVVGLGG